MRKWFNKGFGSGRISNGRSDSSKRNSSNQIYGQLRDHLERMSFQAFRTLILLWLSAKGYRRIIPIKRSGARGRRQQAGADFLADSPYAPRQRVAIQIRHWRSPVQKRVVDEFRGFLIRNRIQEGLLVANQAFYDAALRVCQADSAWPVRPWSIARLSGSLAALGLGVEIDKKGFRVDDNFFRGLRQIQIGRLPAGNRTTKAPSRSLPDFARIFPDGSWWWPIALVILFLLLLLGRASR